MHEPTKDDRRERYLSARNRVRRKDCEQTEAYNRDVPAEAQKCRASRALMLGRLRAIINGLVRFQAPVNISRKVGKAFKEKGVDTRRLSVLAYLSQALPGSEGVLSRKNKLNVALASRRSYGAPLPVLAVDPAIPVCDRLEDS